MGSSSKKRAPVSSDEEFVLEDEGPPPSTRRKRKSRRGSKFPKEIAYVDHSYVDHLHDPVVAKQTIKDNSNNNKGIIINFPEKLHQMLTAADHGFADVISWQPHGRAFHIHQKDPFVDEIMPKFFSQTKLTSFQRQLNLYGFVRLTVGTDRNCYYHEYFLRGRPDLCQKMVRTRVKGTGVKAAASPETEPDFYRMEYCFVGSNSNKLQPKPPMVTPESSPKSITKIPIQPLPLSAQVFVPLEQDKNDKVSTDYDDNKSNKNPLLLPSWEKKLPGTKSLSLSSLLSCTALEELDDDENPADGAELFFDSFNYRWTEPVFNNPATVLDVPHMESV